MLDWPAGALLVVGVFAVGYLIGRIGPFRRPLPDDQLLLELKRTAATTRERLRRVG